MKIRLNYLLYFLPIIAAIIYAITRLFLTVSFTNHYNHLENAISYLLLFCEMFMLTHAIGYSFHVLVSTKNKDPANNLQSALNFPHPEVAILVAARHEPKAVLEKTFRGINNIQYASKHLYFLDDSSELNHQKEAEEICDKYKINLFRREIRHGAKAGIINDCIKDLKEPYIVIFDADQCPVPSFLYKLIAIMEDQKDVAFIQTPQFYANAKSSPVAKGCTYQQAVFYEYICEGKSAKGAVFCCGTNVVIRRRALMEVGGFDESLVTEDVATSVKLHTKGWKSLYYGHVGTFGMGPDSLDSYFKQQARWARGNFGLFRRIIFQLLTDPKSLKPLQWSEYLLSSTYYFIGLVFMILMILPIIYTLFNIPSFFINTDIYLSVFIPYFTLSLSIFYLTLIERKYRIKDIFLGQMLSCITFPVYLTSTIRGLLGLQGTFSITQKDKSTTLAYRYLWPQILFLFLNFIAFVWACNRFYYEKDYTLVVNAVWTFYHFILMMSLFYFNVVPTSNRSVKGMS